LGAAYHGAILALTVNWTTLSFSILPQILLLGMNQKALTVGLGTVPLADWLVIGYLIVFAQRWGSRPGSTACRASAHRAQASSSFGSGLTLSYRRFLSASKSIH